MNFTTSKPQFADEAARNNYILSVAQSLCNGDDDYISNAANIAALIFNTVPNINWAGFYFKRHSRLILGPFQGNIACTNISIGKGVCGQAFEQEHSIIVADVHQFPGHIACDSASNSELVVPIWNNGTLIGVLDIDSPLFARFNTFDADFFEQITDVYARGSDFNSFYK